MRNHLLNRQRCDKLIFYLEANVGAAVYVGGPHQPSPDGFAHELVLTCLASLLCGNRKGPRPFSATMLLCSA
jgi:hypothetical protein